MKQKWKQKLPGILLGLVFLVGLGIFAYPTVADQWNKLPIRAGQLPVMKKLLQIWMK